MNGIFLLTFFLLIVLRRALSNKFKNIIVLLKCKRAFSNLMLAHRYVVGSGENSLIHYLFLFEKSSILN